MWLKVIILMMTLITLMMTLMTMMMTVMMTSMQTLTDLLPQRDQKPCIGPRSVEPLTIIFHNYYHQDYDKCHKL